MSSSTSSTRGGADRPHADRADRLQIEVERAAHQVEVAEQEYAQLVADGDVIQEDKDAAATLLAMARRELAAAQAALERLRTDGGERCASCGDAIGRERLEAIVGVTTCVRCAG